MKVSNMSPSFVAIAVELLMIAPSVRCWGNRGQEQHRHCQSNQHAHDNRGKEYTQH